METKQQTHKEMKYDKRTLNKVRYDSHNNNKDTIFHAVNWFGTIGIFMTMMSAHQLGFIGKFTWTSWFILGFVCLIISMFIICNNWLSIMRKYESSNIC